MGGWNLQNFLIRGDGLERVLAMPRKEMGHRSENFEQIKLKVIKVIIGILQYVIRFLKRVKIFESHFSFKFGLISTLFYLI